MAPVLRSIVRVLLGVAVAVVLLLGTVGAVLRQPTLGRDAVDGLPAAEPSALRRHVEHLAGKCTPRSNDNPAGLHCAADYIQGAFSDSGADVEVRAFEARGTTYRNSSPASARPGRG